LDATTHTRTVWSFEQLAISVPSGLGRTMRTHSLWPVKVFTQYLGGGGDMNVRQRSLNEHYNDDGIDLALNS
jgi:hypothetical protein